MTTDIDELYDMVNSFMRILGEEPFAKTNEDTDRKELKSLMDRYVSRLRTVCVKGDHGEAYRA